ncbi:hypothetical protein [Niallia sp. FSL R7-0271]|uniref:hypothetical protein n=1 Tax=Niallia sp. FSL R7-0271 TaxID=2921678 RepID=UPI0030F929F4
MDKMKTLLSYIHESAIFPEDGPSYADRQKTNLFIFDRENLEELILKELKNK